MWDALWVVIGLPLQYFYRTGPTVLGGWQGMNNADICAKLTKVPSEFWKENAGECESVVEKHFSGYYAVIKVGLYMYTLYKIISLCWFRYTVVRPLQDTLERFLQRHPQLHLPLSPKKNVLTSVKKDR